MTDTVLQGIVGKQCSIIDAVQAELAINAPPPGLLKLYYVCNSDNDGNDHTMFLRATSPEAAYGFWKEAVEKDGHEPDPEESVYVRTVPPIVGKYGKVDWGDIVITCIPSNRG
jgi:hypothetical protein